MVFRRKSIPEPPPAMAEVVETSADTEETKPIELTPSDQGQAVLDALAAATAPTEPAPEPEPEPAGLEPLAPAAAPAAPIAGLAPGRIVHTLVNHELRAGIVTKVYDHVTGDCAVFVLEPVAPSRNERMSHGLELGHGTWSWPTRG